MRTPTKVVIDIETIPLSENNLTEGQNQMIARKLKNISDKDPSIDPQKEKNKIQSLDPYLGQIVCLGMYYPEIEKEVRLCQSSDYSEKQLLQDFWQQLSQFNGTYIHYNGRSFDCPFITKRSMVNRVLPTNRIFFNYTKYDPLPVHFDIMLQISGVGSYISLDHACQIFGIPSPKNGTVKAENVYAAYLEGRTTEIMDYCVADLYSEFELYKIIVNYIAAK